MAALGFTVVAQLNRHEFYTFERGAVSSSTPSPVVTLLVETASLVFRQTVREEDSLFELGVDSLSVIEYCRQLEERLGVDVEVEELFAAESLAAFGTLLAPRVASSRKK